MKRLALGLIVAALSAALPVKAHADVLFQAEAQTLTGDCTGQAVRLEGNHNRVILSGTCGSLLVKGLANSLQLDIASGGAIRVEGAQNRVQYTVRGNPPAVVMLGPDNEVSQAGTPGHADAAPPAPIAAASMASVAPKQVEPPAPVVPASLPVPALKLAAPPASSASPQPTGPLALSGDDEERLADCGGGDVLVTGHRSAYVIRGTCRSLVVRGDLLTVQAIMQPGARITVSGLGSIVSWAVQGRGHPPAGIVHGAGSRIQRAEVIGGQVVK
jgi:hypothetical protein